jgi:hypothetical protein
MLQLNCLNFDPNALFSSIIHVMINTLLVPSTLDAIMDVSNVQHTVSPAIPRSSVQEMRKCPLQEVALYVYEKD